MFGTVSKKQHELELYNAYQSGYSQAESELLKLKEALSITTEALSLISSAASGNDSNQSPEEILKSITSTASTALTWVKYNVEQPSNK